MHAQVQRGFQAMARSDIDLNVLVYEPDTAVWMHGMDGVGVGGCFRGREGVRALYGEIDEAFERWSWTIDRLVDGGDRIAIRGDFVGYGRGSGVKTEVTAGGTAMERMRATRSCGSASRPRTARTTPAPAARTRRSRPRHRRRTAAPCP